MVLSDRYPKAHSLTGQICPALMLKAFKAVRRNRGAAGVDKVSVLLFEKNLDENLLSLMRDLKAGSFQPLPLRRHHLPKGDGSFRPLGIPVVRDRVAQAVLRLLLQPVFEPLFHDASFGFRPARNCHMAVQRVIEIHDQGLEVVLDADIKGFFDNLPFPVIMDAVRAKVADGKILDLIERFLRSGVMEDGVFKPTSVGTPQGGVVSPLLANIVLNHLDWQLHQHGLRFVRYADDFVVLCQSKARAEEALALVSKVLSHLGLALSQEKTRITSYGAGYSFLGFWIAKRGIRMRPKSQDKFEQKLKDLTPRHHNFGPDVIKEINRVIRGTAQYFATRWSNPRRQFRLLDRWIRRRLRAMKFKRFSYWDNRRYPVRCFEKLGLLSLESFCWKTVP